MATGGTFAETILGRSNCAEKLDITRFWNWQDSLIPLQPSDIAAIQTGSRATSEDVKPGQLSNPIVNITSPTSLPDPTGAGNPGAGGGGVSGGGNPGGVSESFVDGAAAGWSQNPGILAATWGDGAPSSSLIQKAMDYGFADPAVGLGGDAGVPAGDAGAAWLQKPSVAVATDPSDKTDLSGANNKVALADADFDVSGVTVQNWRMSGVQQFGGGRIGQMRQAGDITGIVLHETVSLNWSPPAHPASVHMHVERDGKVVQHNQFYHTCFHTRTFNASTVGIEHVNTPYIGDPNNAPSDREGEVVEIKWGDKKYLSLPPAAQLEACASPKPQLRDRRPARRLRPRSYTGVL